MNIRRLLAQISVVAFSVGFASADTISNTYTIPDGIYTTVPLQLNTFDTNSGTLTDIQLRFTGDFVMSLIAYNTDSGNLGAFTDAFGTGHTTITGPNSLTMDLSASTQYESGSNLAAGIANKLTFSGLTTSDTVTSHPSDFADYEGGTGIYTTVYFNLIGYHAEGSTTSGTMHYAASGQSGASLDVVYTYTPSDNSAPEPASMFLMGSALLGAGLLRKRLKK